MTEEFDLTEEFDEPEYREVSERSFLEGVVAAFVEYGEQIDDEFYEYDGHYITAESLDAHSEHAPDARVQIHTVEYEPDEDKSDDSSLETCDDCGEEFKSVEMHKSRSECGN